MRLIYRCKIKIKIKIKIMNMNKVKSKAKAKVAVQAKGEGAKIVHRKRQSPEGNWGLAGPLMVVVFAFFAGSHPLAQVRLPGIIGSNMVLQQKSQVPIWGWTTPGNTVRVTPSWDHRPLSDSFPDPIHDNPHSGTSPGGSHIHSRNENNERRDRQELRKNYTTTADRKGYWRVNIPTPAAGGPYSMLLDDGQPLELTNILIGEVWICSGQSNMEISMKGFSNMPILNANDILAHASNPELRLYHVPRKLSEKPQYNSEANWEVSAPGTAASFSAVGFQFASMLQQILHVPVGIIESSYGGSTIQAWLDQKTNRTSKAARSEAEKKLNRHSPGALYNGMLCPIQGFASKGVLWYQGESNWKEPATYSDYFKSLVTQWRRDWHDDHLPFYYVQIAPYAYHPAADSVPILRAAQAVAEKEIPYTGMVVSVDVGEREVIHPADKTTIAKRLLYWALGDGYHMEGIDYRSPGYQSLRVDKDTVFVHFSDARRGLTSYGKPVLSLEIAGSDRVFYPADSRISDEEKGTLKVFCENVARPVAVRYAFHAAAPGNLYSTQGLPVAPFRTDDWPIGQEKSRDTD